MFIITILFFGLSLQESFSFFFLPDYIGDANPNKKWDLKYKEEFEKLNVSEFSISAGHILHSLTVEDAWTSFNIKMPNKNGIPSGNLDLSAGKSGALIANVPSRPNGYSSQGMHGFVDFMDHVNDSDWQVRGTKLYRLLHVFHMQEMWSISQKAADGFNGVSDDICIGALDHANNGIEKGIMVILKNFQDKSATHDFVKPMTWDDNGESWTNYKAQNFRAQISPTQINSMGLYTQCLIRKFRQTEQPIGLDSCCESKTVGDYTYTLISAGKVPSRCPDSCIYTRKDQNGSQYCFAKGDLKVQCLD